MTKPYDKQRTEMVAVQIQPRNITHPRVLDAMRTVPRHCFVPENLRPHAYEDRPLPIGNGQTISQPYMVALMTSLLDPPAGGTVLEIGTGSGYQAAILGKLAKEVYTIERQPALAARARKLLPALGYHNIEVRDGDGTLGCPESGPYQGIMVTAAGPRVPEALLEQLALHGRLVCPHGSRDMQELVCIERRADGFHRAASTRCTFVPLVGQQGWPPDSDATQ